MIRSKHRISVALIGALSMAVHASGPAGARSHCIHDPEPFLQQLNIDLEKVSKTQRETVFGGGMGTTVSHYNIWVRSETCTGAVIISVNDQCRFLETFTRGGDCTLEKLQK